VKRLYHAEDVALWCGDARWKWWTKWAALTGKAEPAAIRKLGEAAENKETWQHNERQTSIFDLLGE